MSTYHGYISTLDAGAGTNVLDYSPLLFGAPEAGGDIALWPLLPKVADLTDVVGYWEEDSKNAITVLSNGSTGAIDDSAVTLTLAAGEVAAGAIRAGTVLRDRASGKNELVLVTAVSGADLTITRSFGTPAAESHLAGATWEVVYSLNKESSAFGATTGRVPTRLSNGTGILDEQIQLSGTDHSRRYYGIPNYWDYQVAGASEKLDRLFERAVIWAPSVARSDATANYPSFAGIQEQIQTGATMYSASYGAFSYSAWDNTMKTLWRANGGKGKWVMLIPPTGFQQCAYIHQSALRADYSSALTRGLVCSALKSTFNITVPLIPSDVIQDDSFLLLDVSKIKVRFLVGRELVGIDIPLYQQGNDYHRKRFLSEFTVELHGRANSHYFARGVSFATP